METKADIGLIGLAVMGQNLILNMNDHGYTVAAYNRTVSKMEEFLAGPAKGRHTIMGARSIEELAAILKRPRKVMLMVKAGEVVDHFIELLLPHLEEGDLIIDGGNSHYPDTSRRTAYLKEWPFYTSAPAYPAVRRAPATAPQSFPEATRQPGPWSRISFRL